jgi:two-component system, OmpR family, sensor kinase
MRLRRRLVATMIVLVALGLAVVDLITLSALHSDLYTRVDNQLNTATQLVSRFVVYADERGFAVTPQALESRVSPDIYVEIVDADGAVLLARPSGSKKTVDPPPALPEHLDRHVGPLRSGAGGNPSASRGFNVGSNHGPEYRVLATSLPGRTLVVATPLTLEDATLTSLRNIEIAVSVGLLVALAILMTVIIRFGLRPLEGMAQDADAIAAGDLTRRVTPSEGDGEVARLGRALNGMLSQIEVAFSERALSEEKLRSFLADASHELRTPLTSIRGYAELLRKGALDDEASRDRALARIEKEAARMGELVGDLAILAREGEEPEPERARVDLAALAADVVADARTIDAHRPIEMTSSGEVPVAGDGARLEQMVHNLVGNALTHTPPGTPVSVGVVRHGDSVVLTVRDEGPGMSADDASHVFDRFYRGDGTPREGGSGLGLFIVATLARSFGGQARVATAVGEGSTFEVVLPVYRDNGNGQKNGNGNGRAGDETNGRATR